MFSMRNESKILERLRELGEKDFVQEYLEFKQGVTTE